MLTQTLRDSTTEFPGGESLGGDCWNRRSSRRSTHPIGAKIFRHCKNSWIDCSTKTRSGTRWSSWIIPTGFMGALYLREKYGLCMVTDYMDDFTGFLNPARRWYAKTVNCYCGKATALWPAHSSSMISRQSNADHVAMNRNGTEFTISIRHGRGSRRKRNVRSSGIMAPLLNGSMQISSVVVPSDSQTAISFWSAI